ncbi:MAG: pyrroline-5-carboxylate reductase [Bacteroides sp.]|nr:pyrroline-5-carboxylate reductase [Roseburia sp.]MCM1346501.1 pyrroline-5-carboxylate reductase [Bacteroides sp.]MCM1421053.1 pyrroline-5-carboxylate reductase [Bacteroides sp.]
MKITVIGAGNMGGALVRGWSKAVCDKTVEYDITVTARTQHTVDRLKADFPRLRVSLNNAEAVKDADVVVLAVKPWLVDDVVEEIKDSLDYGRQIIVSVAAGISTEHLIKSFERKLGHDTEYDYADKSVEDEPFSGNLSGGYYEKLENEHRRGVPPIFYVMPNIAAEYGESMTFISAARGVSAENLQKVESLFRIVGEVQVCEERLMDAGMMMAGCGIAYVMRYLRAQMEGGVEMGFYPKDALRIALQTMQGAVALLKETGMHPEAAIDKVTTPGGVTIKGLNELDHANFNSAVIRSLKAGLAKG